MLLKIYKTGFVLSLLGFLLTACSQQTLDSVPQPGTISTGEVVLVKNDGRCAQGEVIQITGGSKKRQIPRKYECVPHP